MIAEELREQVYSCIKCGLCMNTCPVYRQLYFEVASPRGKVQLIDATQWFKPLRKNLGKKNCELSDEDVQRICDTFLNFEEAEQSKIFPNAAFGYWKVKVERPLRLVERGRLHLVEPANGPPVRRVLQRLGVGGRLGGDVPRFAVDRVGELLHGCVARIAFAELFAVELVLVEQLDAREAGLASRLGELDGARRAEILAGRAERRGDQPAAAGVRRDRARGQLRLLAERGVSVELASTPYNE